MNKEQELAHLHAPSTDPKQRMIDYWGRRAEKAEDERDRLRTVLERLHDWVTASNDWRPDSQLGRAVREALNR